MPPPNLPMSPPDSPSIPLLVHCEHFDGPLDLLLEEVRRHNVAIEQAPLAPIAARFLAYVRSALARNVLLGADWLEMTATLIYWKSQSLLPREGNSAEQTDRIPDELVRRLIAYKSQLAQELDRCRTLEEATFSRSDPNFQQASTPPDPAVTTVWEMIRQAREMAAWIARYRDHPRQTGLSLEMERDDVSVLEMAAYLQDRLLAGAPLDGLRLLSEQTSVERRSCLFLAMLEMARNQQIAMIQEESFGSLRLAAVAPAARQQTPPNQ